MNITDNYSHKTAFFINIKKRYIDNWLGMKKKLDVKDEQASVSYKQLRLTLDNDHSIQMESICVFAFKQTS